MTKITQFLSINWVLIQSRFKIVKHFTDRNQSKINKIRHSPDPVQSKSSPMLISALDSSPEIQILYTSDTWWTEKHTRETTRD